MCSKVTTNGTAKGIKYDKVTVYNMKMQRGMNKELPKRSRYNAGSIDFDFYVENTTDSFASLTSSPLIKEIHKRLIEVKQNKETEVEYMTLLQRDRENMEQGREEGIKLAAKIIKLYIKGQYDTEIAKQFNLDLEYVQGIVTNYEKG